MPDILKVTSPTITHESIPRSRPGAPTDANIPNIPNAERVTEPNAQNIYSDRQPDKFSRGFESNYDKFLQLLRMFPDVGEMYKEIFFTRLGLLVNAGIEENFAKEISEASEEHSEKNPNTIYLNGFICKEPIFRTTPFGREITDTLIAVNRTYNKSDYIPCIAWGHNSRYTASLPIGTNVMILGRIQSREYQKRKL